MAIYQGKTKLTSFSSGLTSTSETKNYAGEYTIVPAAQPQTLQTKNTVLTSELKVIEDKQLLPENIKEGVELFGVTGTATSGFAPNGTEWTFAVNKGFYEIKYGNGVFVGCCTDGWIYYSYNGINWYQSDLQLPVEDGIYPEIIYDNETWIVNDAANLNCYISKDNGQVFSKVDDISSIFTVVKNGIIIFGNGSAIQRAPIKTLNVTTQLEGISNPLIATNNNNGWVVGDKSGGGVYYSTDDGVTWTVSNLTSENICTLKYCNNIWIASFQDSGVYWSIDGITWTQSNLTTGIVGDVAFYNNKWHIIGYSIENLKNASWYSLNGKQWYPNSNNATSQLSDNSISISNSIYCNSNIMITGGLKDLYQGVYRKTYVLYSLTGANWKLSEQSNNNVLQIYALEHGKNIWIASGSSGTYYSLTWGEISESSSGGGTELIEFSIDGTTYQAEDGMTWAEWIDSAYNTDGYYFNTEYDTLSSSSGHEIANPIGTTIQPIDQIQASTNYVDKGALPT